MKSIKDSSIKFCNANVRKTTLYLDMNVKFGKDRGWDLGVLIRDLLFSYDAETVKNTYRISVIITSGFYFSKWAFW